MTKIVGILNVTTNSFSDGGDYTSTYKAIERVNTLFEEGADIVDIGAASTSYGVPLINHDEEWKILEPILKSIDTNKVSIDTYNYQTAEKAISLGVYMINDVFFGKDQNMLKVIVEGEVKYILMHSLVLPANKETRVQDISEIKNDFEIKLNKCIKAGIKKNNIILDPGIGFSTNPKQSLEVFNNIDMFKIFDTEIMIGHSRKSFLEAITKLSPKERDLETLAISIFLRNKVEYLRVHNVNWHKRAFNVLDALAS